MHPQTMLAWTLRTLWFPCSHAKSSPQIFQEAALVGLVGVEFAS